MRSKLITLVALLLLPDLCNAHLPAPQQPQAPINAHAVVEDLHIVACVLAFVAVAVRVIAWIMRGRPVRRLRFCPVMIFAGGVAYFLGHAMDDPFFQALGLGMIIGASCIEHCGIVYRAMRKLARGPSKP